MNVNIVSVTAADAAVDVDVDTGNDSTGDRDDIPPQIASSGTTTSHAIYRNIAGGWVACVLCYALTSF